MIAIQPLPILHKYPPAASANRHNLLIRRPLHKFILPIRSSYYFHLWNAHPFQLTIPFSFSTPINKQQYSRGWEEIFRIEWNAWSKGTKFCLAIERIIFYVKRINEIINRRRRRRRRMEKRARIISKVFFLLRIFLRSSSKRGFMSTNFTCNGFSYEYRSLCQLPGYANYIYR